MIKDRAFDVVAAVTWVLVVEGRTPAQDPDLQRRFLSQYQPSAKKLQEFYSNITIHSDMLVVDEKTGKEVIDTETVFKANGPWLRQESTFRLASKSFQPGRVGVKVLGPTYSFRAQKLPLQDGYALNTLSTDSDREEMHQHIQLTGKVFFSPFTFLDLTVEDMFLKSDFFITGLNEEFRDGTRLVRMSWGRKKLSTWIGWFMFSPENSWAIQEYSWGTIKSPNHNHAVMEYEGKKGDIPIVRKARYWQELKPGHRTLEETYIVKEVIPGSVSREAFTLSAFGLPEPMCSPARRDGTPWYLWFAAAGVGCMALMVGFRRAACYFRDKRKAASTV